MPDFSKSELHNETPWISDGVRIAKCQENFNVMVPQIVNNFDALGHKITYVPMAEATGLCAPMGDKDEGLCAGGSVHPISAGYLRMASAWSYSILQHYKLSRRIT